MRTRLLSLAVGLVGGICLMQFALGLFAEDRIVSKDLQRRWLESRGVQSCPVRGPTQENSLVRRLLSDGRAGRTSMQSQVAALVGECRWGIACAPNDGMIQSHVQVGQNDPWERSMRPTPDALDVELLTP